MKDNFYPNHNACLFDSVRHKPAVFEFCQKSYRETSIGHTTSLASRMGIHLIVLSHRPPNQTFLREKRKEQK